MNRSRTGITLSVVALCVVAAAPATAAQWTLSADTWAQPRSGERVLTMTPVRAAVRTWSQRSRAELRITHAGGESSELWAAQLRGWLIALGVPGDAVTTRVGGAPDRLGLAVHPAAGTSTDGNDQ